MASEPSEPFDHLKCARCGYDLYGLPAGRCPECGKSFDPALRPPRLHPGELVGIALRLGLLVFLCFVLSLIPFLGVFLGATCALGAAIYTLFPAASAAQTIVLVMRQRNPGLERRWVLIEWSIAALIYALTVVLCISMVYAGCAIVLDNMGL